MIRYSTKNGKVVEFRMPPPPWSVVDVTVNGRHAGEIERDGANRFFAYPAVHPFVAEHFHNVFEAVEYLAEVAG